MDSDHRSAQCPCQRHTSLPHLHTMRSHVAPASWQAFMRGPKAVPMPSSALPSPRLPFRAALLPRRARLPEQERAVQLSRAGSQRAHSASPVSSAAPICADSSRWPGRQPGRACPVQAFHGGPCGSQEDFSNRSDFNNVLTSTVFFSVMV